MFIEAEQISANIIQKKNMKEILYLFCSLSLESEVQKL